MNMIENPKTPPETPDPNEKPDKDDCLDEAIADSMIASDPPAVVSKGQPTAPPRRPKNAGEAAKPGETGKDADPGKSERS